MSDLPNNHALLLIALAPFIAALFAPWVNRFARPISGWILATVPAAIFLVLTTYIAPENAIIDGMQHKKLRHRIGQLQLFPTADQSEFLR